MSDQPITIDINDTSHRLYSRLDAMILRIETIHDPLSEMAIVLTPADCAQIRDAMDEQLRALATSDQEAA